MQYECLPFTDLVVVLPLVLHGRKEFAGRGTFFGLGEASSENTIQSVSENGSQTLSL
jgi:hypothetical protein